MDKGLAKLDEFISPYGIVINYDTLKTTPFAQYRDYLLEDVAKGIEIGKVAQLKEGSGPLLLSICYGDEGVDFTYDAEGKIVPLPAGRAPLKVGDLLNENGADIMGVFEGLRLGSVLGIATEVTDKKLEDNAILYALSYGKRDVDYRVEDGRIVVLTDKAGSEGFVYPTAIGDLIHNSNAVVYGLELGTILGIDTKATAENLKNNALMYSLCYGVEGVDYTVENDVVKMLPAHAAQYPTTIEGLTQDANSIVNGLQLGAMLGIASGFTEEDYESNTLMYSIAYGNEGTDYTIEWEGGKGRVVMAEGHEAKTVRDLTENSNDLINNLELGTMLGIGTDVTEEDKKDNALMLSICYGKEGEDYDIVDGKVVMRKDHSATTIGELTENSNDLIQRMEVETLMEVTPKSDKLMHYLAYGNEMAKDEHGEYLKDTSGKYEFATEKVTDADGNEILQYVGGGKYVYVYGEPDAEGVRPITGIRMLPDPNKTDGSLYPKRTVADLTKEDADVLEGMKIGDVMEIDSESSGLMQAMKDWTLKDLSTPEKIDELKIGDILDVDKDDPETSGLMKELAGHTVGELKEEETINSLNVGNILGVNEESNGLMKALAEYNVGQLKEEETINKLNVGEILGVNEDSSSLMQTLGGYKVGDLKDEETINGLKLGELLGIDTAEGSTDSKLMQALADKTVADLKDEDTINSLKLGDILEIDESSSGIMQAMRDWQLSDLSNQKRIERLRIGQIIDTEGATGLLGAIGNWRISDLSDSSKIESLTLGDVITIGEGEDGILVALKDTQIGRLQEGINELTLEELLGDVSGNTILRCLAGSTVQSLSADLQNLTIATIFGDEIFSYMEIVDGKTYQKLYEEYFENHNKEGHHGNDFLPKAYTPENLTVKTYYDGTEVGKGFFAKEGDLYKLCATSSSEVSRDNEGYYYNLKTAVDVEAEYQQVLYKKDASGKDIIDYADLPEGITEEDIDENGYFDLADGSRGEAEKVVRGYSVNGVPLTETEGKWKLGEQEVDLILSGDEAYYYTRVRLEERYYDLGDESKTYALDDEKITTSYFDGEKKLDRYVSGVWFLLLGNRVGETRDEFDESYEKTVEGMPGKVVFSEGPKLTEMATNISEINSTLTDTTLWKLYFFGILPDDPYSALSISVAGHSSDGIRFEHIIDGKTVYRKVENLNDITISELVPLINELTNPTLLP